MKKRTKKFAKETLALLFSACLLGGIASSCAKDDASAPNYAEYVVSNVESLSVNTTPEYFDTYGVGETIAINNYETTINGKTTTLYAVLQKDYEVVALLTPDVDQITYTFVQSGNYNVIYYAQLSNGNKEIVKNVFFTVGEQAYIDVVFKAKYMVNETVSFQAECVLGQQKTTPTISVKSPLGKEVALTDFGAKLTECGIYTVSYEAQMNGESVSRKYYLTVTGKSNSYADYIHNVTGVTKVENDVEAPKWSVGGEGVRVTGESFVAFRYTNVVDVDTLTSLDNVVNFLPLGTDGYSTLSTISIKFIDVYDETNVISYECGYVTPRNRRTYCKVKYKDIIKSRRNAGGFYDDTTIYGMVAGGVYFNVEQFGLLEEEYGKLKWLRAQMDYDERKFYLTTGATGAEDTQSEVLDLDDPLHVGYGNEWQGFTTGEVYIQIELTGSGAQSGCIVREIAGEKLYGEKTSTKGPDVLFDVEKDNKLPTGEVGRYYPFPSVYYSVDAMDGKILYPNYDIVSVGYSLFDGLKYREVDNANKDGFTPKDAGIYRIIYQVIDDNGNKGTREIYFEVKETLGEKGVAFDYELPQSFKVGTNFKIPKFIPQGLSYLEKCEESILYNGKEYANNAGDTVFLDSAGQIKIRCSYEDYLGETYEFEKTYTVEASQETITELKGAIPKYVLKGRSIVLPNMTATNYSKNPSSAEYNPEWKLTVDGQELDTEERTVSVNKNHGEKVHVVYSIANQAVYESDMTVIEANYLADRFYVTSGSLTATNGEECVTLTATTDATVDFINPLIVDDTITKIPLTLNVLEDKANFEYVDVYFEDYLYSSISIFVRIIRTQEGLFAKVNNEGEWIALNQAEVYSGYTMEYNVPFKSFEFSSRMRVLKDVNGNEFKGFPSNRINVRFDIKGVSGETQLLVAEFGMFAMASQYKAGNILPYEDRTIPSIVAESSFRDNSFEYGTRAYFPAIEARTALSGLTTAKITIIAPSGKVILQNKNAYNDYWIDINEWGNYKITYEVPFRSTIHKFNSNVQVFKDTLPEISLKENLAEAYSVGDKFIVPEAVVDGAGAKLQTEYYITLPDSSCVRVQVGGEYEFKKSGTYKLQVIVMDEYNTTSKIWKIKVVG